MSRRQNLAGFDPLDPLGGSEEEKARSALSMEEADAALFGELARRDSGRTTIKTISIFHVHPDVQQPRRAVPNEVRKQWSGLPRDVADMFTEWLKQIDSERKHLRADKFDIDAYLWSEKVERRQAPEEEVEADNGSETGPIERAFLKVIDLAVSIRRDSLANPITVQSVGGESYRIETGERRWLAYHLLYAYFNGRSGKPDESGKWEQIPCVVVKEFNVWRQASENALRADLNAIGRARQYAILMMDLLKSSAITFRPYADLVEAGQSDRAYYEQVVPHRVPNGKGEMLLNGLGLSHRSAFTRCRTLLQLPDAVWSIGDDLDLSEDELLRIARIEPPEAQIAEAQRIAQQIVATRNNLEQPSDKLPLDKSEKQELPPALFDDAACKRGKKLFSRQNQHIVKELFSLKDGVGQAQDETKAEILLRIREVRRLLDKLETTIDSSR